MTPTIETEKYLDFLMSDLEKRLAEIEYDMFENGGTMSMAKYKRLELESKWIGEQRIKIEKLKIFGL